MIVRRAPCRAAPAQRAHARAPAAIPRQARTARAPTRSVATASQQTPQYTNNAVESDKILNRAYHLMNDGINEASRRLFEFYLSTEAKNNDRNDPLYMKVLQSRGITLARSGKLRLATESAEALYPLFMESARDASYSEVGLEIAHLLRRTGAPAKAKDVLRRTMELVSTNLGTNNLLMSSVLQLYAALETAELPRAIQISRKALEIKEAHLGNSEPWKLVENYYFLVRSSLKLGETDAARELLETTKKRLQNIDTRTAKPIRDAASTLNIEFDGTFSFYQVRGYVPHLGMLMLTTATGRAREGAALVRVESRAEDPPLWRVFARNPRRPVQSAQDRLRARSAARAVAVLLPEEQVHLGQVRRQLRLPAPGAARPPLPPAPRLHLLHLPRCLE